MAPGFRKIDGKPELAIRRDMTPEERAKRERAYREQLKRWREQQKKEKKR